MPETNFSIIIPHYNIPCLLKNLLESVPYDKDDVEVIVVDDRSDKDIDILLEVKEQFRKSGVRFYRNNNGKKGAGTCRNIGIKHAIGKWLIFADSDDQFTSDMYDEISKHVDSEAGIIFFESESIDESGIRTQGRAEGYNLKINKYINESQRRNELLLRYDMPVPWGKMISSQMVKDNRIWFDEIPVSNDVMFSAKCGYYAGKIEAFEKSIYQIMERQGSLTTTKDPEKFDLRTNVFIRLCRFLKENLPKNEWKELRFNGNIRLIEAYKRGYGIKTMLYIFFGLLINGVKPIEFRGMSVKTAPATLRNILQEKRKDKKI